MQQYTAGRFDFNDVPIAAHDSELQNASVAGPVEAALAETSAGLNIGGQVPW
jgi:hypothetical protein